MHEAFLHCVTDSCGCIGVGAEVRNEHKGTVCVCVWSHLTALTFGDVAHPMLTCWFWYTVVVIPTICCCAKYSWAVSAASFYVTVLAPRILS